MLIYSNHSNRLELEGSMMDFVIDRHTSMPAHAQIQEQIKLALLLGRLRPGDTLPSIRDIEKDVGISQHVVRKAYSELESLGILKLHHGKGVIVDKNLEYPTNGDVSRKCESITRELIVKLYRIKVTPMSFVRYLREHAREDELQHPPFLYVDATHAMAEERAARISEIWRVSVAGLSIEELGAVQQVRLKRVLKILTTYLRYDEVVGTLNRRQPEVIPLGLAFSSTTLREFSKCPKGACIGYVIDDRDYRSLSLIQELYRKILLDVSMNIETIPMSHIKNLMRFVRSTRYHKVIFSNRIWESLPEECRRHPKVTRLHMTVDLGSLENARIRAGVIV